MLEVHSALTGEPIAVLEDEEGAGDSVEGTKAALCTEDWSDHGSAYGSSKTIAQSMTTKPST